MKSNPVVMTGQLFGTSESVGCLFVVREGDIEKVFNVYLISHYGTGDVVDQVMNLTKAQVFEWLYDRGDY